MKHKKLFFSLAIVGFVGVLGLIMANKTLAYRGDYNQKGPSYSEERHVAMTQALANKDYQAWKDLMANRGRVTQVVNENNFPRFVEMHNLMVAGKTSEANVIRQELGLGQGMRHGQAKGQGNGNCRLTK